MNTSQTPSQRALSLEPLREGDKAFFSLQHQNALHQLLLAAFREWEAENDTKRADLARISGHSPAVITRLLSDPSNYEASTIAILMAAMGREIDVGCHKMSSEPIRRNNLPKIQSRIAQARSATSTKQDVQSQRRAEPVPALNSLTGTEIANTSPASLTADKAAIGIGIA
jgi:hypothetical protein